jgi:hypothetical protein
MRRHNAQGLGRELEVAYPFHPLFGRPAKGSRHSRGGSGDTVGLSEDFLERFNQLTYRGMRVGGVRVATWSSRDGWSGDSRLDAEWLH